MGTAASTRKSSSLPKKTTIDSSIPDQTSNNNNSNNINISINSVSSNTTNTAELLLRIKELEADNDAYKLELQLMYHLDDIRDDHSDPAKMFMAILELMGTQFNSNLCLLYLFDRESEELELWAQHPAREDIEKRIRHPASLFSFLEENNKNKVAGNDDSSKDVKITLLDVFPPFLKAPPIATSPPSPVPTRSTSKSIISVGQGMAPGRVRTSSTAFPIPKERAHSLPPINHIIFPLSTSPSNNNTNLTPPSTHTTNTLDSPSHIAAITIIMHGKQMGLLILGRYSTPFTDLDIRLLKAAESQIDSAVVQAHTNMDFMLSNKELEVIYRVDRIRDENHSLEDLLSSAVQELDDVLMADITFVMLYKVIEGKLTLQAASSPELWSVEYEGYLGMLGQEALDATKITWHNNDLFLSKQSMIGDERIHAAMCVPLILQNQIIGVFGALNTRSKSPFLLAHRRLLKAIASQMDNAIYDSLETFRLRQVLGRSVDRKVLEKLLLNPNVEVLKPERTVCTVLFADIRGSTHLAEHTAPDLLGRYINAFLSTMSQVIISYEGTLDKFIGDEVMAIFNAPFPQPDHALRAVTVGFAMQEQHAKLMQNWQEHGIPPTPIGVGIATGELIAGEYGCSLRTDYTVIGRAANLGARITGIASGGTVLCSEDTFELIKHAVEATPVSASFKGIGQVTVYHITEVKHPCLPTTGDE